MKDPSELTLEAQALIRSCPSAINALAARIGDTWDFAVMFGTSRNFYATRLLRLRILPVASLADFLEFELGGGVPTDFLAWLM